MLRHHMLGLLLLHLTVMGVEELLNDDGDPPPFAGSALAS